MVAQNVIDNIVIEKNHRPFYFKMAILLALIFARNIFDIYIPITLILLMSGFIVLTGDRDEIITLGICCIPLFAAFQYKYTLLFCVVVYCFKYRKEIKINGAVVLLALMMFWELLHLFGEQYSWSEYLRSFAELVFCTMLMMRTNKKINYIMICRMLAICTLVMTLIVLLNSLEEINYNFEKLFTGSYRLGIGNRDVVNYGVNYNANGLGFICNISIVGILQLILLNKQRYFDNIMIVLLVFFGLLTMSRTFIVCFIMILVFFILARRTNMQNTIKGLICAFSIVGVVMFVVLNYAPYLAEQISMRFQESDLSNGRVDLFAFYNQHIFSNSKHMFFGIGLQERAAKIVSLYNKNVNSPHNGVQEILLYWGIPGLLMFLLFIFSLLKKSKSIGAKRTISNFIPLILIIVKIQAGQVLTSGQTLLSFAFSYLCLCISFKEKKNEKSN